MRATGGKNGSATGIASVSLSGEVDIGDAEQLCLDLVAAVGPGTTDVVLDLSEVTYLGSAGISALLTARRFLEDRSVALWLGPRSEIVERVLDLTGVLDYLLEATERPAAG